MLMTKNILEGFVIKFDYELTPIYELMKFLEGKYNSQSFLIKLRVFLLCGR